MLQSRTPLLCLPNFKFCPRSISPLAWGCGCRPSIDYEKPRAHQNMIVNHIFIRLMSHFLELINNKQVLCLIPGLPNLLVILASRPRWIFSTRAAAAAPQPTFVCYYLFWWSICWLTGTGPRKDSQTDFAYLMALALKLLLSFKNKKKMTAKTISKVDASFNPNWIIIFPNLMGPFLNILNRWCL